MSLKASQCFEVSHTLRSQDSGEKGEIYSVLVFLLRRFLAQVILDKMIKAEHYRKDEQKATEEVEWTFQQFFCCFQPCVCGWNPLKGGTPQEWEQIRDRPVLMVLMVFETQSHASSVLDWIAVICSYSDCLLEKN